MKHTFQDEAAAIEFGELLRGRLWGCPSRGPAQPSPKVTGLVSMQGEPEPHHFRPGWRYIRWSLRWPGFWATLFGVAILAILGMWAIG